MTNTDTDTIVRLALGTDTNTGLMVWDWELGIDDLGYELAKLKSAKPISVSFQHPVTYKFLAAKYPGLKLKQPKLT